MTFKASSLCIVFTSVSSPPLSSDGGGVATSCQEAFPRTFFLVPPAVIFGHVLGSTGIGTEVTIFFSTSRAFTSACCTEAGNSLKLLGTETSVILIVLNTSLFIAAIFYICYV